jgi:hypothetical protein
MFHNLNLEIFYPWYSNRLVASLGFTIQQKASHNQSLHTPKNYYKEPEGCHGIS